MAYWLGCWTYQVVTNWMGDHMAGDAS